jgi:hypothetical protein
MAMNTPLNEKQARYLKIIVSCFFIGLTGVFVGFISNFFSLQLLGEIAFLIVASAVLVGGLFILLGIATTSVFPEKKNRDDKSGRTK